VSSYDFIPHNRDMSRELIGTGAGRNLLIGTVK
jgi:hypothetical protein